MERERPPRLRIPVDCEEGNPLPGLPRVQSEVFLAAGKVYDVMINPSAAGAPALPVYDRELSLSNQRGGSRLRDAGLHWRK